MQQGFTKSDLIISYVVASSMPYAAHRNFMDTNNVLVCHNDRVSDLLTSAPFYTSNLHLIGKGQLGNTSVHVLLLQR